MINNTKFKCLFHRIYLTIIRLKFKFDPWHVSGNISCRTYKREVLSLVKSLGFINSAVEIGCGLGDLISNIDAPKRVGIDIDKNVINAAAFLHG